MNREMVIQWDMMEVAGLDKKLNVPNTIKIVRPAKLTSDKPSTSITFNPIQLNHSKPT